MANGEKLFFDPNSKANCGRCHRVANKGGKIGPNLSFVGSSRSKHFLLESIVKPNKIISTGYSLVLILTRAGKFINGIKNNEDKSSVDLVDKSGKLRHISKDQIKKIKTQKLSMMPGNFGELLTTQQIKDILAYCQTLRHPLLIDF